MAPVAYREWLAKFGGGWRFHSADDLPAGGVDGRHELLFTAPEWLPIESAPKDGTSVLIYTASGIVEAVFGYQKWEQQPCYATYDGIGGVELECQPTHWMPLPQPPKA